MGNIPRVRLIDDSPATDVGRSDVVCLDRNASKLRLVDDFLLQVVERPSVVLSPLAASNRCPFADAFEVLKSNAALGVFRLLNHTLGDAVVHVFGKASLFLTSFLEQALGRLRTLGLQPRAQLGMALAQSVDLSSCELFPVAVCGDVGDTQINAQKTLNLGRWGRLNIAGRKQVELPVDQTQIGFTALRFQQLAVMCSADVGNPLATGNGPDRNLLWGQPPSQDAAVIGDCAERVKCALFALARLVGIRNLRNATNSHLGGQSKARADRLVRQAVKRELLELLILPRQLADLITSVVKPLDLSMGI